MFNFFTSPTAQGVEIMYILLMAYSAIIQSLPTPEENTKGGIWYKCLYNFLVIIATDFKSFQTKLPVQSTTTTTILSPLLSTPTATIVENASGTTTSAAETKATTAVVASHQI